MIRKKKNPPDVASLSETNYRLFVSNEISHIAKAVWRIEGILYVLVPLVLTVLGFAIAIAMK